MVSIHSDAANKIAPMQQPSEPEQRPTAADLAAQATAEAIDVLRDVLVWELALPRWQEVERVVESMQTASATADVDTLREITADLELLGPVRITRIGATPQVPAPDRVRERTNYLIHSLSGTSQATPPDTGTRRAADDRSPGR